MKNKNISVKTENDRQSYDTGSSCVDYFFFGKISLFCPIYQYAQRVYSDKNTLLYDRFQHQRISQTS